MIFKTLLIIIYNILVNFKCSHEIEIAENSLNLLPDYDFSWIKEKESELRRRFLDKKKENQDQDYRLKLLEKLSNTSVYVDEILHSAITNSNPRYKIYKKYESLYRNFLSMNGVKYVYKRDFFWRTWRLMNNINGSVICYRCNSFNSSNAQCGYWIIEEKPPPCPYEIFSLANTKTVCVINYTDYHKPFKSCPLIITLEQLLETCNNPIETKWRVQRNYSAADQRAIDICQGRESCEITTMYTINADSIIFRLINSTNHIFYSRVMKSGHKNYACDEDCGSINFATQAITKNDSHIVLNLLKYNPKNKREYIVKNSNNSLIKKSVHLKKPFFKFGLHYKQATERQITDKKPKKSKNFKSLCKIIQDSYKMKSEENLEENDSAYYF